MADDHAPPQNMPTTSVDFRDIAHSTGEKLRGELEKTASKDTGFVSIAISDHKETLKPVMDKFETQVDSCWYCAQG